MCNPYEQDEEELERDEYLRMDAEEDKLQRMLEDLES